MHAKLRSIPGIQWKGLCTWNRVKSKSLNKIGWRQKRPHLYKEFVDATINSWKSCNLNDITRQHNAEARQEHRYEIGDKLQAGLTDRNWPLILESSSVDCSEQPRPPVGVRRGLWYRWFEVNSALSSDELQLHQFTRSLIHVFLPLRLHIRKALIMNITCICFWPNHFILWLHIRDMLVNVGSGKSAGESMMHRAYQKKKKKPVNHRNTGIYWGLGES